MPRILLADDSTHAQRMGSKILSAEGFEVVVAADGEKALEELKKSKFDLVLASVNIPPPSGYEICEYVKGSDKHSQVPVLLLVGAKGIYDKEKAAKARFDGLLKKPFEASVMLAAIKPLMERAKPKPAAPPPEPSYAPMPEMDAASGVADTQRIEIPRDLADKPMFEAAAEAPPEPDLSSIPSFESEAPAFSMEPPVAAAPPAMPAAPPVVAEPAAAPEPAPTAEAKAHWVAEPTQVSDTDEARLGEAPAPAAPEERKPEAPPDWGELLKVVEEAPAPAPATAAPAAQPAPAHAAPHPELESILSEAAQTFGTASQEPATSTLPELELEGVTERPPAAAPEPEAMVEPLLERAAPTMEAVPEPPAPPALAMDALLEPEPHAASVPAAAPPEPTPVAAAPPEAALISGDAAAIRDAVQASLERLFPALVDEVANEVLRRFRREE